MQVEGSDRGARRAGDGGDRVILAIEGALPVATVALTGGGGEPLVAEAGRGRGVRGNLFSRARALMAEKGLTPEDLDAVAVGIGPGSFTGLRVAMGTALGLGFGHTAERAPELLVADTATIARKAARLEGPFRALVAWGRLRALLIDADEEGSRSRVVPREELERFLEDDDRPLTVWGEIEPPRFASGGPRLVAPAVGAAAALAELAAADSLAPRGARSLSPHYAVPPDAVLPVRPAARSSQVVTVALGLADVELVEGIEERCFPRPWGRALLEPELDGGDSRVALGVGLGRRGVAGYAFAHVAADEMSVVRVAVDPDARRQGLGRRVMQALIEEARRRELGRIDVDVALSNRPARELYASVGFVETGSRERYYADGEDAVLMSLFVRRG